MAQVLVINGHNYSAYIKQRGVGWNRENINSNDSGRTLDGKMHVGIIAAKRKLSYELGNVPQNILAQLDSDLSAPTFSVTYLDLHGAATRTFYCTSFAATLDDVIESNGRWSGAKFNIIEV